MPAHEPNATTADDRLFRWTLAVVLVLAGIGAAIFFGNFIWLAIKADRELAKSRKPEWVLLKPFSEEVRRLTGEDCPRFVYDPRIGETKPLLTIEVRYTCASKSLLSGNELKSRADQLRALLETRYPKYSEVTTFRVTVWTAGSLGGLRWSGALREVTYDESTLHPQRPGSPPSTS